MDRATLRWVRLRWYGGGNMTERRLFDDGEVADSVSGEPPQSADVGRGTPRLRVACRDQVVMRLLSLDQMLPVDDEARTVVAFVEQCDLSELYGVRVRASAGASSFRRKPTLEECLVEAQEQITALKEEVQKDPAATSRRQQAARERAVREHEQLVRDALAACAEVQAAKEKRGGDSLKQPARGSTTDPDARKMKMPDGGTRPAFNVQFATDTASQVVVGVDVTNQGTDHGLMSPMIGQIEQRTGQRPQEYLADGGFNSNEEIDALNDPRPNTPATADAPASNGTKLFVPVKEVEKKRKKGIDPFAPLPTDTPQRAEWRQRMGTESAQAIYKERASTAECVNALARQRGLTQFRVRGLPKVKIIATWFALAHNVLRWAYFRLHPRAVNAT